MSEAENSTSELPAPLVSADVDLRGYEFMPLYGDRLLGSETWISASPEGKVAAVRLWWRAYAKEIPAASLPDDDKLLAEYAGYGNSRRTWAKLRTQALRGFVKCSDGRLYHEFLAPLAIEAWTIRLSQSAKARKRWNGKAAAHAAASGLDLPGIPPAHAAADAAVMQGQERKGKQPPSISPPFVLPKTIDPKVWAAFEEHRRAKRAPMTDHARWLIVGKLDEYHAKLGNDRNAVLNQAIEFGYQGVFPLKKSSTDLGVPPAAKPKEWWETDRGIEEKAKQLGIAPEETLAMLKARVFMAVGDGPWFAKLDGVVAGYIQDFSQQEQRERSA